VRAASSPNSLTGGDGADLRVLRTNPSRRRRSRRRTRVRRVQPIVPNEQPVPDRPAPPSLPNDPYDPLCNVNAATQLFLGSRGKSERIHPGRSGRRRTCGTPSHVRGAHHVRVVKRRVEREQSGGDADATPSPRKIVRLSTASASAPAEQTADEPRPEFARDRAVRRRPDELRRAKQLNTGSPPS